MLSQLGSTVQSLVSCTTPDGHLIKIPLCSSFPLLNALKGQPIYSTSSLVRLDKPVSVTQDVSPIHLVIEEIKPKVRLLLGLPV